MIDATFVKLGDCVEIQAGYPFRGPVEQIPGGSVRVVQMRDLNFDGTIRWTDVIRTNLGGRKSPDWLVPGDLLLVTRGNRYYASTIDAVPGLAVCGPHLFHLRLRPKAAVVPRFLAWQMNQSALQRSMRKAAEGSSQLSIRRPEIEALLIAVPPLSDQEKIVRLAQLAMREQELLVSLIRNRERQLEALAAALTDSAIQSND